MKPIRVAVVGTGHLGSIHARIYSQLPEAQLVAVCDSLPDKAATIAGQYGCDIVRDFRGLIGRVDAVSIAGPTTAHFAVAKEFLAHGIHSLIEKPITSTLKEADALLALAKKKKALLQVGHVERFNSAFRKIRDSLTDPRFIEVHRLAPFQVRGTEVGVVLDLMIHDIDMLLGLVPSPIKRVDAVGVKVLSAFEDIANARLTFANGAVANLTASRISREAVRKFRIFQPDAYVSIDLMAQSVDLFRHENFQIQYEKLEIPREEPLKAELISFLDSIRHKKRPAVSGEEAREALAVALKITQLIHKNQPRISKKR